MPGVHSLQRPTKRQKIDAPSTPSGAHGHSRLPRTIPHAVYGKSETRKEGALGGVREFLEKVTPRKAVSLTPVSTRRNGDASLSEESGAEVDELGEEETVIDESPTKRGGGCKRMVCEDSGEEDQTTRSKAPLKASRRGSTREARTNGEYGLAMQAESPMSDEARGCEFAQAGETKQHSGKQSGSKKKFRGWKYLDEDEDMGINNQDRFAQIAAEAARAAIQDEGQDAIGKSLRQRRPSSRAKVTEDKPVILKQDGRKRKKRKIIGSARKRKRQDEPRENSGRDEKDSPQDGPSSVPHTRPNGMGHVGTDASKGGSKKSVRRTASLLRADSDEGIRQPATEEESEDDTFITPRQWPSHTKTPTKMIRNSSPFVSSIRQSPAVEEARSQKRLAEHASRLKTRMTADPSVFLVLRDQILAQIMSRSRLPVSAQLHNEFQKVHQLLSQTVSAGEGNSMLIIGSRGSGKTSLVETAISNLMQSNGDDFHVVRLNGFIHTDDKLALREIWRQLGKELEGEDVAEKGMPGNYADTLTSLLALLSHQDESQGDSTATAARSVIFVLDEFDLFAQHPRQTLLYNLFDVAQSHRNAPIAVLGLTTKVNVVENLEKRVKSRFGQRFVHLGLPRSLQVFKDVCSEALRYHHPPPASPSDQTFASKLARHENSTNKTQDIITPDIATAWNEYMTTLLTTAPLAQALQSTHRTSNVPADFLLSHAYPFLTSLTATNLSSPVSYHPLNPPDSSIHLLPALSTLQLSLLISACRLDIILDSDLCSFAMAYDEYVLLASRSKLQSSAAGQIATSGTGRLWGRDIAKGAWEGLIDCGLLIAATGGSRTMGGSLWRCDVGLEEVGAWLEGEGKGLAGTMGLGRWCREI